jgi:hypothetical protein
MGIVRRHEDKGLLMVPMIAPEHTSRIKKTDLLSSAGAGVLGAGLALLFAEMLKPYAASILVVGLIAHGLGMFQKHQLERGGGSVLDLLAGVRWFVPGYRSRPTMSLPGLKTKGLYDRYK